MNLNTHKIHSAWCMQLISEHEQICYQYRTPLSRPSIQISDHKTYWARWNERAHLIEVSSALIESYSWDIVIQVFKHEMAHQYVSEVFKANESHGPYFQKACDKLGVIDKFKKSGGSLSIDTPLDSKSFSSEDESKNKLILKAKKLLSLAQSDNENEAALAMKKVQELYFKYNFSGDTEEDYSYIVIPFHKKRVPATQSLVAALLSEFYFVKCIFSETYDPIKISSFKTLEILGRKENVKISEYVFHFVNSRIDILWKSYFKKHAVPASEKRSYQLGLLNGLFDKLKSQKLELQKNWIQNNSVDNLKDASEQTSPINYLNKFSNILLRNESETKKPTNTSVITLNNLEIQNMKALNTFTKKRFPKIKWSSGARTPTHRDSYGQGFKEGKNINIYKGIENKSKTRGLFLK